MGEGVKQAIIMAIIELEFKLVQLIGIKLQIH